MVTPPRFEQRPQKTGSRTALWVTIILACVLLPCIAILGVVGYGYLFIKKNISPLMECTMTFQSLRDATLEYANKNGGKMPNAASWQDDIRPYYREIIKKMEKNPFSAQSADAVWGCPGEKAGKMTGIAYNSDLSGVELKAVTNPRATVVLFETDKPVKNEALAYTPRPDSTSPTIFGEPRGWLTIMIEGDLNGSDGSTFSTKSKRSKF